MSDGFYVQVSTPGTARINRDGNSVYNAEPTITDWSPVSFGEDGSVQVEANPTGPGPTRFETEEEAEAQIARSLETIRLYEQTGISPNMEQRAYRVGVGKSNPDGQYMSFKTQHLPWLTLGSWFLDRAQVAPWSTFEHQPNLIRQNAEAQERGRVERLRQQRADLDRQIKQAEKVSDESPDLPRGVQHERRADGSDRYRLRREGTVGPWSGSIEDALAGWEAKRSEPEVERKSVGVVDPEKVGLPQ